MGITLGSGWVNGPAGERVPIWSGEFHYFRNPRRYWPRILRNMADAGLTMVTSFVQPNYHEYEPGKFDFRGETAPERNLPELMELAGQAGLWVQLRLGPACCEWRESGGTSFATPWSEVSEAFWQTVAPYAADRGGPLLLYQVHNEWVHPLGIYYIILPAVTGFDGFTAPSVQQWAELVGPNGHYLAAGYSFSMDYLPRYLASLHADISALNAAWGTDYDSFKAVQRELEECGVDTLHKFIVHCKSEFSKSTGDSPRRMLDLLDWANCYPAAPLADEVDATRKLTRLPVVHNWAMGDERRWCRMTHLDLAGYDVYAPMDVDIWQWNKYTYDMQTSPFPFSNEFMCGTIERYEWGGQGVYTSELARMLTLSYVMGGMKGVNLYMFVERDNWLQCPLDERGGKREVYVTISSMIQALRRTGWHEAEMARDLGLYKNPDYHRYADGVSDDGMFDEGYREPYIRDGLYGGHSPKQQYVAAFRAFHDAHIDFAVFKDTRGAQDLSSFKMVLAYALGFLNRRQAEDLIEYARSGGSLVLFPCVPTRADDGQPMDLFTSGLGITAFDCANESHPDVSSLDVAALADGYEGDLRTSDGVVWAQARRVGLGRVLAVNANLADNPEALEELAVRWGGCRKFADTGLALTDAGIAVHPEGRAVVVAVNGTFTVAIESISADVSLLPQADAYTVIDELEQAPVGVFAATDGRIRFAHRIGPRDGAVLSISPGRSDTAAAPRVEVDHIDIPQWHSKREDEQYYHQRYLGAELDDTWTRVPLDDWTLPAIASGRVFGVQGWFYLREIVKLSPGDGPTRLHIRPRGYHNLGIVYLNGVECGRFGIERPGAEMTIDVTSLVEPGDNILAVRLYRQSLDCHDRGGSGFDLIRFECGSRSTELAGLHLKQEHRDQGEVEKWHSAALSSQWQPVTLPLKVSMDRAGDALWLVADVEATAAAGAVVRVSGSNCVAALFINGEYVVKSPALPASLHTDGFLRDGSNRIALQVTPDNFETYMLPKDKRYEAYIRDGFLPLEVGLDEVRIEVRKLL